MRRWFGAVVAILVLVLFAASPEPVFDGVDAEVTCEAEVDGEVSLVACLTCGAECLHSDVGASEVIADIDDAKGCVDRASLTQRVIATETQTDSRINLDNCNAFSAFIGTDMEPARVLKLPRGMAVALSGDVDTLAACVSGRYSGAGA